MGFLTGQLNRPQRLRHRAPLLPRGGELVLALGACLLATPASADRVLDRVVAQVEGQVIALSDVRFEARVAMVERGGVALADAPLDEATLKSALDLAIAQRAVGAEADKLGTFLVDPADVEARVRAFEGRFADRAALERFLAANGADRVQLGEVLGRALRAERALDARVRLRAQVSEADVRRAWEAKGSPPTYDQMRVGLREELVRARYQAVAQEELTKLRAAAQVRVVAKPADLVEAR